MAIFFLNFIINLFTEMPSELQSLTDAWGKWMADQAHVKCKFTASTSYSSHPDLAGYIQDYQCQSTYQDISYDTPTVVPTGEAFGGKQTLINNSDQQQTQTFSWSNTTSAEFTYSFTEALKVGVKVSGEAGVPLVASGKIEASVELDLSSTQSQTSRKTQEWKLDQPIKVPAHCTTQCSSVITMNAADMNFTATSKITGWVAIWFDHPVDKYALLSIHHVWIVLTSTQTLSVVSSDLGCFRSYH
jgi:hypothetical protein